MVLGGSGGWGEGYGVGWEFKGKWTDVRGQEGLGGWGRMEGSGMRAVEEGDKRRVGEGGGDGV